jgi:hypothetical protein
VLESDDVFRKVKIEKKIKVSNENKILAPAAWSSGVVSTCPEIESGQGIEW